MALRVYMERSPNDRNAVHLFHGGASSMSNPFDNVSDEILAGWWSRISSTESWGLEMEDFWQCAASDQSGCKGCVHYENKCCEASFHYECPQVVAEFNLDERHFN